MKDGYPVELANKIGHIRLVNDPVIQEVIQSFEDPNQPTWPEPPAPSGRIDIDKSSSIEQVLVIDGGNQIVPNIARPHRQVGFIQVAAVLLKMKTIDWMRAERMIDPRDLQRTLGEYTHHTLAVIPLAGVHVKDLSVRESIRQSIHRFMEHYELYDALAFLIYRLWEDQPSETPSMECLGCGTAIELPRGALQFECKDCGELHTLSDYLGLTSQESADRPRLETVSSLRAILEALLLFSFVAKVVDRPDIMGRTLFLLDGPLLLRAQLARLVEPIRDLIAYQRNRGLRLHMIGVEKSGGFRNFADSFAETLIDPGDFFIPSTEFILEMIQGKAFEAASYRNRVNYGAKVIVRAGPHHVLALNIPTGEYVMTPEPGDLIGFDSIIRALPDLISYSYENALLPVVLANSQASISNRPSGGILHQFVDRLLSNT